MATETRSRRRRWRLSIRCAGARPLNADGDSGLGVFRRVADYLDPKLRSIAEQSLFIMIIDKIR
jgi:hypothetical protein